MHSNHTRPTALLHTHYFIHITPYARLHTHTVISIHSALALPKNTGIYGTFVGLVNVDVPAFGEVGRSERGETRRRDEEEEERERQRERERETNLRSRTKSHYTR